MSSIEKVPGGAAFLSVFKGDVITATSPSYDTARSLWNGDIDRRPLAVVKATDDDDVVAAVRLAREAELPLAIRGGGHSYPGHSMCDDGITLDLSRMGNVVADPTTRRVRAQGGALLGSVDTATLQHGLVMPAGIVSHTGLAGLALGGGIGYLTRSFGMTCDSFVRLRLVTAEGEIIHASEEENPDLFWALRGGGGNFGVVTEFECNTQVLGPVQGGPLVYSMADAVDVLYRFGQLMKQAPRTLSITCALGLDAKQIPPATEAAAGHRLLVANVVYRGEPDDEILREVRSVGKPLFDAVAINDFRVIQTAFDEIAGYGAGWYMKSGLTRELSRPLVEGVVEHAVEYHDKISSGAVQREVFAVQSLGGAVQDLDDDATAYSGRAAEWHIGVEVGFTTAEDRERIVPWTRDTWTKTKSLLDLSTSYVNLNFEPGENALADVFGAGKYERLRRIKTEYDPTNLFSHNFNIKPLPTG
ncbi:FAD-binding oxidoreductase [Streptomyces griseoruber]|uniref:FAD-binding PCMH-type domain-containing protein n=1 Tax=Streptomyces griseoruber TaxID=1943 RepID=A0A117RCJ8_9ACTN|nr:FAD-binding oxidoreductase [Streptomyces griseoruber]KUN83416.1 hypothetical protein AQJ64_17320 [Streptomyces griseoruber]